MEREGGGSGSGRLSAPTPGIAEVGSSPQSGKLLQSPAASSISIAPHGAGAQENEQVEESEVRQTQGYSLGSVSEKRYPCLSTPHTGRAGRLFPEAHSSVLMPFFEIWVSSGWGY